MIKLTINCPEGDIGFVEDKRSFMIEGSIETDTPLKETCVLQASLYDDNSNLLRRVKNTKKPIMFLDHPLLTTYDESIDPNKDKLKEYGFAPLVVDDINDVEASIHSASNKLWFDDNRFDILIINASNTSSGALFDDGMNYLDDNNKPYEVIKMGNYKIEVILLDENRIIASASKKLVIGKRNKQLIGRFNPISHRQRLNEWCKDNDISFIKDLIPGYLNPFLGWIYHMGLLKMYRANDLCLFNNIDVKLFNYLIDSTSTSYETELAYLQSTNSMNRVEVYYYDIGEACIGDRKAIVKKYQDNEFGCIQRIDILNNSNCENIYYLDRRYVLDSIFDVENAIVDKGSYIAIAGNIKPIQLDPNDFKVKDDLTYEILDYPNIVRYTFNDETIDRKLNMKRIDNEDIGNSVYEFYNVFKIKKSIDIKVECMYKKGKIIKIGKFRIEVS